MATEARRFQVGVFVISATVIAIAALIWLGASRFFEETDTLVTYFSESVQGLEPGAAVKFRGVPAGRVEHIGIAPDGELIEVVMSVEEGFGEFLLKDPNLRAQVQLAGITGLRYVEIDRHAGDALQRSPVLRFEPPYPVILSTPSSIREIMSAFQELYDHVKKVDLPRISADVRTTLQSANDLLRDPNIRRSIESVHEVAGSAARVVKNFERITGELDLEPVVRNITQASKSALDLFQDLNTNTRTQVKDALANIALLTQTTQQFVVALQHTVERMNRTVGNLEQLTEEIRNQPSRLLFSSPPEPRRPADRRR